jgi:hypothetical protein
MTDLPYISATQISLFLECQRKFAFKYIEKVPEPQRPGAELGTEVQDTQIDPYLASARPLDFSRPTSAEIANSLLPLLPAPMAPGMKLRRKFQMPSPSGKFTFVGEFDIWADDSSIVTCIPHPKPRPLLGDIKTTKDLKYQKSEADLLVDVQCQLYAAHVMFAGEQVDELDAVWWYARTRKPWRAQRTHVVLTASHVFEQFGRIEEVGQQVAATRIAKPKTDDLPPNVLMCDAYGGCPYRHICNLSPAVQAEQINGVSTMSGLPQKTNNFLANLRKPAAAPAPADGSTQMAVHPAMKMAAAAIRAEAPVAQVEQRETVPAPEALPDWCTAPVDPRHAAKAKPAINPPESALPPAPPVGAPVGAAAPAPIEAPKKRGRPAKLASNVIVAPEVAIEDIKISVASEFPRAEVAEALRKIANWLEG